MASGVVSSRLTYTSLPEPGRQPLEFVQGSGAAQQFQAVKTVELLFDHGYARLMSMERL